MQEGVELSGSGDDWRLMQQGYAMRQRLLARPEVTAVEIALMGGQLLLTVCLTGELDLLEQAQGLLT